jgi:DNA-binding transcriptional ArsR family regulator
MPESGELHHKVDKILKKVESIDNFMPWLVRPNSKQLTEELLNFFKKKKRTAKVYLSIDGVKNVSQIAEDTSIAQPNVSNEISLLLNKGLIEPIINGGNTIYKKNKIDKVLNLSRELTKIISVVPNQNLTSTTNEDGGTIGTEGDNNSIEDTSTNEE